MEPNASSFVYVRDDTTRRIRVTARRPLEAADLIAVVQRQAMEGTWTYGALYDLRDVTEPTSREDAVAVAASVERIVREHGKRGPVALVTRAVRVIGAGYAYARDSTRSGTSVEVFWDMDEAEQWLTTRAGDS